MAVVVVAAVMTVADTCKGGCLELHHLYYYGSDSGSKGGCNGIG